MSGRYVLGIDLGTTNTVTSVWEHGQPGPVVIAITQPDRSTRADGRTRDTNLPSAARVTEEGVFTGLYAKRLQRQGKTDIVTSIKRFMGRRWRPRGLPFEGWTAAHVAGCILRAVLNELESQYDTPPESVVITVPASFGTEARRATLRAAQLAGFDMSTTRLFDEPAAALIHQIHGADAQAIAAEDGSMMMIDIGGGTLDVSMLELSRKGGDLVADIQGTSRYAEMAGDDFDLNIAGLLLQRYEETHDRSFERFADKAGRRAFLTELLVAAEEVKKTLSSTYAAKPSPSDEWDRVRAQFTIASTPHGEPWDGHATLSDLALALREFFPRTRSKADRRERFSFYQPIQQCLDSASHITGREIEPMDLRDIFITGGSANLPMVGRAVQRILHGRPTVVRRPMHAVALGAAAFAGMKRGYGETQIHVRERLYDSLYLQGDNGSFQLLLPAKSEVPSKELKRHEVRSATYENRVDFAFFVGGPPLQDDEVGGELELAPLARRRVEFPQPLVPGQRLGITVGVTPNREILFGCEVEFDGRTERRSLSVSGDVIAGTHDAESSLPPVNPIIRGEA
jgi:molecular chaperone DnaK